MKKKEKILPKKRTIVVCLSAFVVLSIVIFLTARYFGLGMESTRVVLLETNYGNIKIELYDDMPITTGNFERLVKQGTYDGVIFHRVMDGFMIQGGDPTGTGYGDPSIPNIQDEFSEKHSNTRGTVSMANRGPNTGSSQFFINLGDNSYLDFNDMRAPNSKHPVFGEVVEGMDVVDKIGKVKTTGPPQDRPLEEVKIIKATII